MVTTRWPALVALLKDAWPTWLALVGVTLSFAVSWLFSSTVAATVRYCGTALQVLGLLVVAFGLSEMRRLFGRPSLSRKVAAWFGRVPAIFRAPEPITAKASIDLASLAMVGEARVVVVARPGAPLEERVSVLEDNLVRLRDELDAKVEKARRELATVRESIEHESHERRADDQRTARIVEEVAVGGLHLESVGLLWLFLGVLCVSIPDEIAALLGLVL